MPSPQAKPLHASSLQQELLQRMERAHNECPTTGQTRSNCACKVWNVGSIIPHPIIDPVCHFPLSPVTE